MEKPIFENPIMLIIAIAVAFLICILITRAIFSIPRFLKYQKIQTAIMLEMAERNGMPSERSEELLNILEWKEGAKFDGEADIRHIRAKLRSEKTQQELANEKAHSEAKPHWAGDDSRD